MTPPAPRTPKEIMADVKRQHEHDRDEKDAWPNPLRVAEPITDAAALPVTARSLAKLCDSWKATSGRGPVAGAPGSDPPWRMADSVLLKGRVGRRLFSALWVETAKGNLSLKLALAHGVGRVDLAGLKAYLTQDLGIPWLEGVESIPLRKETKT